MSTVVEPEATTPDQVDEQPTEVVQPLDEGHRRQVLEERVLFLSPTTGKWEGRYKIPTDLIKLEIDGEEIDTSAKSSGVTTPYTVMLTDKWPMRRLANGDEIPWKKAFNNILKDKEKILQKLSVPFQTVGARIVPMHKARDFFFEIIGLTMGKLRLDLRRLEENEQGNTIDAQNLRARIRRELDRNPMCGDETPLYDEGRETQSIAYRWWKLANEFCLNLDSIFDQIKANITPRSSWDAVKDRVPSTPEKMRAKFYMHILPVELAGSSDERKVTTSDLDEYDAVVRAAANRAGEEAIKQVLERPIAEFKDRLAALADVVARDGRVTAKSFRPVNESYEKLLMFSNVASIDPEFKAQIRDFVEGRMGNTDPRSLDSVTAAQSGFTAAMNSLMSECESAERQAKEVAEFGKQHRSIDLD